MTWLTSTSLWKVSHTANEDCCQYNYLRSYFNSLKSLPEEFENDMNTLTDGLTIREDVVELTKKNVTFPKSEDLAEILRSQHNVSFKMKIRH